MSVLFYIWFTYFIHFLHVHVVFNVYIFYTCFTCSCCFPGLYTLYIFYILLVCMYIFMFVLFPGLHILHIFDMSVLFSRFRIRSSDDQRALLLCDRFYSYVFVNLQPSKLSFMFKMVSIYSLFSTTNNIKA